MLGLRSAQGRAALASGALVLVLVAVAILAVFRVRQHQEQLLTLEDTAATVAALEHARAQLFFELAALSGLVFSADPTLLDAYHEAAAVVEQDLGQARAEAVAAGKADYVATLDDLAERVDQVNEVVNATLPIVLQADPGTRVQLVGAAMPGMWAEIDAIVVTLDQLAGDEQAALAAERAAANDAAAVTSWIIVGFGGIALLVVTGIVIVTIASVVGPLVSLRATARAITSGDLESRANVFGPEEVASVARDFNEMTAALAAKTEEYIATTNLTGDMIVRLDKDGRFTFLNDGACQLFRRSRETLLGTDAKAFMHPEDLERAAQAVREVMESKGLVRGFESRLVTPAGTKVLEWNGCPLFDEEGQYGGIQITGRDITERKQMEEALEAKTEEYIATTNLTGDIIAKVDEQGTWTLLNDAACRFFGKPREELLGTDSRASVHPEDLEPTVQAIRNAATTGEPIRGFVNRQLTPMGTRVVEWNASPFFDEEGQYAGIQMTGRDVTERRQMEEALRESEEQYRAIFEQAADSVVLIDAETGALVQFNDRTHEALGYTREEFEKLKIPDFEVTESPEEIAKHIEKIIKEGADTFESKHRTKSGEIRNIEVRARAISIRGRDFIQGVWRDITERKRAEEELASSEERLKVLFESAPDAYYLNDLEGNFVDGNKAAEELIGYKKEKLIGKSFLELKLLSPEQLRKAAAILAKNVQGLPTGPDELALTRKGGNEVPVEIRTFPVKIKDQTLVLGIARDITERKKAEEALAAKTKEYIATTNLTGDIIARLDKRGNWAFLNDAACQFYGKSREELLGTDSRASVHPEDIEPTAQAIRETRAKKALVTGFVNRQITPMGTRVVEWNGYPLFDEEGQYAGIQITGRDITERKQMEEAVRESEARYRLLAENTSDLIWTMDLGLKYTYMSPSVEHMRGYSAEEIMGTTVAETMTPASLEVARKTLAEELAIERMEHKDLQRSRKLELEMYCKDGSTIWTEMNMTFLRDPDGQPVGILGVTRDISERKRAEQEREGLHAELELRAITDGLTGLYDHAQFYRRLAEEIDRSKRYKYGFAVVMMDVDDFKRFNDTRGHQAGDRALRFVGYCIRAGLRRSDIAFRYGGDEFAAILPHANSPRAAAAVDRMNRRITKSLKQMDGGSATRLSLSAGVACFPEDGTVADDLVRIADAALYNAKWVARARDIMGQREDIQSLVSALVSRRAGVEGPASGAFFRPEALHEQQARIVSSVASSIAVALKDAGVAQALEDPDLQVLATVGAAAEIKDRYIRGHPERTSERAVALAEEMGLSPERVRDIRIAGLLHDIGKVTVSEGILNKPGKLTRREFASIKDHPIVGATLVSQVKGFERLVPIIRHHHERFDGKGYPDGLAGEDIPPEARILSVVDVFDALTHQRSYRTALSREEAIAELERSAGTQFDPLVVKAFLALVKRRGGKPAAPAQAASEGRQPAAVRAPGRGKR
jgi:diguanylate cyclase (GGDEF)-like protein/PAS domain S-box-containing protein/putative nucleotidyltransferase with HDIG domain